MIQRAYSSQWISWGDFLGTENADPTSFEYVSYEVASEWAKGLGIKTGGEYKRLYKSYDDEKRMPSSPWRVYEEFTSWGDFLGTGTVASNKKEFRSFEEARSFVRTLGLKSTAEWNQYAKSGKKPADIPSHPKDIYRNDGYVGITDFLGAEVSYISFKDARAIVLELGFQTRKEWLQNYAQVIKTYPKVKSIPKYPMHRYEDEWQGWPHFLGLED